MSVLAHAGGTGWDEVMVTITPLLVSISVLAVHRRRLGHHHPAGGPERVQPT